MPCWAPFLLGVSLLLGQPVTGQEAAAPERAENELPASPESWLTPIQELSDTEGLEGVLYERWNGVRGKAVREFQRLSPWLQKAPDVRGVTASLSSPDGDGQAYGARLRGFIESPRSGKVRLVVTSDDNSEVWLSLSSEGGGRLDSSGLNFTASLASTS